MFYPGPFHPPFGPYPPVPHQVCCTTVFPTCHQPVYTQPAYVQPSYVQPAASNLPNVPNMPNKAMMYGHRF